MEEWDLEPPRIDDDDIYKSLGLKCGLEIHQQLITEKKLFCRCPARMKKELPTAEILRHMRPTLSELGEYDGTALMEFKTKKNIVYQLFPDVACTYEMDDTPPFPLNQDAVDIALVISLLLNCNIVNELHVSRKQYLDGSIPTGFQRTGIVGVEGWVPYKNKRIGIIQLGLEEDACREIKDVGHDIVFRTDRLSIPLVEVVTHPDIRTPLEAGEVAEMLGRLMRTTGMVRRGSGSVRQDVNVSIEGGTRVEIKGVAKFQYIPRLVAYEALRQRDLLKIRDVLKSRGITDKTLQTEVQDLTSVIKAPKVKNIKDALAAGGVVKGVRLEGFGGILDMPIGPRRIFAEDVAGRVRVIACLDKMPNMVHSSKFLDVGFSPKEVQAINKAFHAKHTDDVILVWGPATDVETALKEIVIRASEATLGIPRETRQVMKDGTTDFERILPGPDRMYPDTDTPPMEVGEERLDKIRKGLPEMLWDREARLAKLGLPKDVQKALAISPWLKVFDSIVEKKYVGPVLAGVTLTRTMRALSREGVEVQKITDDQLLELFKALKDGEFTKDIIPDVLKVLAAGNGTKDAERSLNLGAMSDSELTSLVKEAVKAQKKKITAHDLDRIMGVVMEKARGRVDGSIVAKKVKAITGI